MKLMQVWIVCCVLFFVTAELYQWLQDVTLPMPIFAIAGALLAVASNSQTWLQNRHSLQPAASPLHPAASAVVEPAASDLPPTAPASTANSAPLPRYYPGAQLPNLNPQPPDRSPSRCKNRNPNSDFRF
jgi:hypothetical protein